MDKSCKCVQCSGIQSCDVFGFFCFWLSTKSFSPHWCTEHIKKKKEKRKKKGREKNFWQIISALNSDRFLRMPYESVYEKKKIVCIIFSESKSMHKPLLMQFFVQYSSVHWNKLLESSLRTCPLIFHRPSRRCISPSFSLSDVIKVAVSFRYVGEIKSNETVRVFRMKQKKKKKKKKKVDWFSCQRRHCRDGRYRFCRPSTGKRNMNKSNWK